MVGDDQDALARAIGDVITVTRRDGTMTWVSPAITRVLGWKGIEHLDQEFGTPGSGIVHPDDLALVTDQWRWMLEEPERELRWQARLRAVDGSWRWMDGLSCNRLDDPAVAGVVTSFRDVSEQKVAEQFLLDSEERFRALVRHATEAVIVADPDGRIRFASAAVSRLLGVAPADLVGTIPSIFIHPDDLDRVAGDVGPVFTGDDAGPAVSEFRMAIQDERSPEGPRWRWVEATCSNAVDDPVVGGIVASLRDVDHRKRVEVALRASEEQLLAVLQNSGDGIAIMDAEARLTWVSRVTEAMLGTPAEELVGRDVWNIVHPDDLELAATRAASALAGNLPGDPFTVRVAHPLRGWVTMEVAGSLLPDVGGPGSVILNLRDAAWRLDADEARRRSEARFRALVERSFDLVLVVSPTGQVNWVSPAMTHVLGHDPAELLGPGGQHFIHPDDFDDYVAQVTPVFEVPGSSTRLEVRLRHADGSWRWFEESLHNLVDDDRVGGIVIHAHDISDRRAAEDRFRTLTQSSPIGIFQLEEDHGCTYVNERWVEITGRTPVEARGDGWMAVIHPEDLHRLHIGESGVSLDTADDEIRVIRPSGEQRWVAVRFATLEDDEGRPSGNVATMEDITERVLAERDSQRLTDIFDNTRDLVGIADAGGRLLYLNESARRFLGLASGADLGGVSLVGIFGEERAMRLVEGFTPDLRADGMWSGELGVPDPTGETVPMLAQLLVHRDDDGRIEFYSGVLHDISERKRFESELAHQATHDPLTGLPNRSLLLQRLDHALARARRHQSRVAVLFLDLDHFKVVNDSLGHDLGDQLLVAIAERLDEALRPTDTVARFGGDEFVVLCEDLVGHHDAEAVAERVHQAVSGAFTVGDREVFVGVSIGIAFPDTAAVDAGTLISDADAAMYQAKARGRSRWEVFDHAMRGRAVDRLDIENDLRRALERRELRIHYQPIVRLDLGTIEGVEALVRWEHPERGLLRPDEFIRVAEETGIIVPIGAWVLEQACRQVQRWRTTIPAADGLALSVNLSGRQLNDVGLVESVGRAVAVSGMPADHVQLEITESVLMDDVEASEETLVLLRGLGVGLSIDDFGTGYSSMSYLRRFPVDVLKVDRSFVDGLGEDSSDSAIVAAIVTLAHTLGMRAVAEGVETAGQLAELRRLGCDSAQGYLISRPVVGEEIVDLLTARPVW